MKKKKIVALLTACMLMTGMFTGCGSSQQAAGSSGAEAGQTQTGDNSLFNEPGQLPIVNEPVTLTVFAPANPDGSWEDCEFPYKSRVMPTSEPLKTLKAPYMARNTMKWGFFRLKSQ